MPFPYEVSSDSMEVDYTGTPYHHGYEAVLTPTPITLPNPLLSLQIPIGVSYLHLGEEDTYGTWPSGGDHYSQNQYVPRAFPALDLPAGLLSRSLPMERRNMGTVLRKHDTEKCMGEYRFACAKADQAYVGASSPYTLTPASCNRYLSLLQFATRLCAPRVGASS